MTGNAQHFEEQLKTQQKNQLLAKSSRQANFSLSVAKQQPFVQTSAQQAFSAQPQQTAERTQAKSSQGLRNVNIVMGFNGQDFSTTSHDNHAMAGTTSAQEMQERI